MTYPSIAGTLYTLVTLLLPITGLLAHPHDTHYITLSLPPLPPPSHHTLPSSIFQFSTADTKQLSDVAWQGGPCRQLAGNSRELQKKHKAPINLTHIHTHLPPLPNNAHRKGSSWRVGACQDLGHPGLVTSFLLSQLV